ncbi:MAG: YraN family protein [Acidaminococcaceae bacterium]|jgi:putative endonuclease|nr:YraN family protein [Acidaminococcaceae bacterium]
MHERAQLGRRGEDIAAAFLERQGYTLLERNYRWRKGEIDVIAAKEATIAFVEVKTRRNLDYGLPSEAVTYSKQQKIRATALHYLQEQDRYYQILSFDVIEVLVQEGKARVRWLPHCF